MWSISSLTTLKLTSASSSAMRISLQRFADVFFGQGALAAQVLKGTLELICKVLKHLGRCARRGLVRAAKHQNSTPGAELSVSDLVQNVGKMSR